MEATELIHYGIPGMKWGVRRYQNKDGSLTKAGEDRYNRDVRENNAKKKDNRMIIDGPDPKRWAREDLERRKDVVDAHADLVKEAKKIAEKTEPKPTATRMDLSKMSDKELRDKINRELLEQQYNKLFSEISQPQISRGRQVLNDTLDIAGSVLAVTGSALTIALAVQKLKGA